MTGSWSLLGTVIAVDGDVITPPVAVVGRADRLAPRRDLQLGSYPAVRTDRTRTPKVSTRTRVRNNEDDGEYTDEREYEESDAAGSARRRRAREPRHRAAHAGRRRFRPAPLTPRPRRP